MRFLVFEGLDGSGKSTLIRLLADALAAQGVPTALTREPGGTPLAEEIRSLLLRTGEEPPSPRTELLLYEASRAQHVDRVIAPALARGAWAICDRFIASTVAFQGGARGLARDRVDWLNAFAIDGRFPDLTVLLDLPVEESERRRSSRAQASGQAFDRLENEARSFHQAVRASYLAQAQEDPRRWLVLDALQPPQKLFDLLWARLRAAGWLS